MVPVFNIKKQVILFHMDLLVSVGFNPSYLPSPPPKNDLHDQN